jgi:X-X-X-Leu-X-X-Gly heptad repeat protein
LVFPVNVHRMTQTLAATLVIVSRGAPQLQTGSAQLSTTGNVSGFVIFRQEKVSLQNDENQEAELPVPDSCRNSVR